MIRQIPISTASLPPFRREEILRYAGAREETPALTPMLEEAMAEAEGLLSCRVCWREVTAASEDGCVALDGIRCPSEILREHLAGCGRAVLFAATIGIGIDRHIARYGKTSPAKALLLQAIGAERIEALCDAFCAHISAQYAPEQATARFSPGYGDLPLEFQRELFRMLECSRHIGLTLNESLMMSPSKSVTAILGIGSPCGHHAAAGCSRCKKTDCIYRRSL